MDALKVAVDAPSGLNTETGVAHDDCFFADHTITMFAKKTGMFLKDGIDVCGEIYKACLGAPDSIVQDIARIKVIGEEDPPFMMPFRFRRSTKFDYGRVLVVAGSENMPGAAALASNASISTGAGLVYLFTPNVHSAVLPEVIPTKVQTTEEGTISKYSLENILDAAKKVDVIAMGPGFGDNIETIGLVRELIERVPDSVSLVIDADALRAVDTSSTLRKNIILTPHTGEFAKMIDVPREEVENHPHNLAKRWARKLNCIIHLKYVPSIITDGDDTYWNINGNPGMATAGCGDVLTGMIASLIAQGIKPLRASALAAFLHSLAGDWYAINYGEETLTASKMIEALRIVMSKNIWELD